MTVQNISPKITFIEVSSRELTSCDEASYQGIWFSAKAYLFSISKMSFKNQCNAHSHADFSQFLCMNQTDEFERISWPSCVQTMYGKVQ